jgi:hypothetical protein
MVPARWIVRWHFARDHHPVSPCIRARVSLGYQSAGAAFLLIEHTNRSAQLANFSTHVIEEACYSLFGIIGDKITNAHIEFNHSARI